MSNDINNTAILYENTSLEYAKIYKINGNIDRFRVKLINNENITRNNSPININYIFKYGKKNDIDMNFLESNMSFSILKQFNKGNKRDIVISFFYNKRNNKSSKYSYYLRLYQESEIKNEKEDLNTLAITSSSIFKYDESIGNSITTAVNFTLKGLLNDEIYHCYLFIKKNNSEGEEYKVQKFTIEIQKRNSLIFVILILISLIIIVVAIFSIYLMRIRRKNKELEEKVRNISFKDDDDEDSSDEDMNPKVNFV